EHEDVRDGATMLDRPHFTGAEKAHLDLVVDDENAVVFADLHEPGEIALRRNHVSAGPLDHFHEEGAELRAAAARVPRAGIFVLELPLDLRDAIEVAGLAVFSVRAAEAVRERNELRAVGKLAEGLPIPVGGSDRGGAERSTVIASFERDHSRSAGI